MVARQGKQRGRRVTTRVRRVGVVVGLATASGVAVGCAAGPVGGVTAASAVASATAAIVSLWRAENSVRTSELPESPGRRP